MKIPVQISARNMSISQAAKNLIELKARKLEQFYDGIIGCRIMVEAPHRHHHKGHPYHVRIDLTVPGAEIAIRRDEHEDLYVAIREAFDDARRKLQDYARMQQGKVKHHEIPPEARIIRLFPEEGYGFIETPDGREIYFHRNSVINFPFEKLKVGMQVKFAEEQGIKGPQASTVRVLHPHKARHMS
ncbi:MAG: ribosome-associated translation inhibitor RaiA [Gammaproteobacteria bacterium]|nr:MAG: ribosome-associated translation inhibitor RaiA [Gammaproteobacteria bacterium]